MSRLEKVLVNVSAVLTAATGFVYLVMKYFMTNDDPFSVLNHPWQPQVLALHLLIAPLLIFAIGLIMRDHVFGWLHEERARCGRASGIYTTLLAVPMIASGYLLQIFTDPGPRRWLAWVHIGCGVLFTTLFLVHLIVTRMVQRALQNGVAAARSIPKSAEMLMLRLDWHGKRGLRSRTREWGGGSISGPGGRRS